jgi:membrane-anchored mycosin MYCP
VKRSRGPAGREPLRRLLAGGAAVGLVLIAGSTGAAARVQAGGTTVAGSAVAGTTVSDDGGGRTWLADDSSCTSTEISQAAVRTGQHDLPWEIAQAGIGGGATPPDTTAGKGVVVAIIDTGLDGGDSQFAHVVVGGADLSGSGGDYLADSDGHGTMVASIIAAQPSSQNAMIGIAPGARLLIYREAGCDISLGNTEDDLADAINQAVAAHARIINISQDGYVADTKLQNAVKAAFQAGVLIVTAAGNYGDSDATDPSSGKDYGINPITYPAAYAPYLLTVGAVDENVAPAAFSGTGDFLGVTAPGVAIVGVSNNSALVTDDGTSFAAPYVAAVAAILLQLQPDWTPGDVMKVLESTATGNGHWSATAGWGEIQPQYAVQAARDDPTLTALTPLYGAGPNADGPASAATAPPGPVMAPVVQQTLSAAQLDQEHGAYYSLGVAGLVVVLALAGSAVVREARRRGARR